MKTCHTGDTPSPVETPVQQMSKIRSCSPGITPPKWLVTATVLTAAWFICHLITVLLSLNQTLEQVHQAMGNPVLP